MTVFDYHEYIPIIFHIFQYPYVFMAICPYDHMSLCLNAFMSQCLYVPMSLCPLSLSIFPYVLMLLFPYILNSKGQNHKRSKNMIEYILQKYLNWIFGNNDNGRKTEVVECLNDRADRIQKGSSGWRFRASEWAEHEWTWASAYKWRSTWLPVHSAFWNSANWDSANWDSTNWVSVN